MARYIEAPAEHEDSTPAVFLAGGITGCPDWQEAARHMLDSLPIAILNPRRENFPIEDPSAAAGQVAWEFEHLSRADVVLFWFPDSGPITQPIALYELGAHAAAGKRIVVGCDRGYVRRMDVVLQLGHVRPEVTVHDDLEAACAEVRSVFSGRYVDTDPMPVFVIKGKDRLAPEAIAAYSKLCLAGELDEQWVEVETALAEIVVWQQRHPDLVKTPSHKHVSAARPFDAAVNRYASNMRAAGLDVSVTQIAPGQIQVSGRVPGSEQDRT